MQLRSLRLQPLAVEPDVQLLPESSQTWGYLGPVTRPGSPISPLRLLSSSVAILSCTEMELVCLSESRFSPTVGSLAFLRAPGLAPSIYAQRRIRSEVFFSPFAPYFGFLWHLASRWPRALCQSGRSDLHQVPGRLHRAYHYLVIGHSLKPGRSASSVQHGTRPRIGFLSLPRSQVDVP